MLLIGLMSGTSADGVDAALVEISGEGRGTSVRLVHFISPPFDPMMRAAILRLCSPDTGSVPDVCALHSALGEVFAAAALRVASEAGVQMQDVAAVCSHGQTVWHQPQPVEIGGVSSRGTLQLGSPAVIAARTGCRVISDFRSADMAAGGQGAPLVPFFDWAVLASDTKSRAVLNLGGIANVTYLPRRAEMNDVIAFDTGPGNMVVDALVLAFSGGLRGYDGGGHWAAQGATSSELLEELLSHPYLALPPPKSTGREIFGQTYAAEVLRRGRELRIGDADLLATVTELTARAVADLIRRWLPGTDRVIVGGGGCHNETLMRMLRGLLHPATLSTHDELGIPGDAKESMAFALLGYETLHGRPSNVPSATGAQRAVVLGSITPAP